MSRNTYGILFVLAFLFALIGRFMLFSLPVPTSADIELQRVEEFFSTQIYVAIGIGAVVGLAAAFRAPSRIRHRPDDRGTDYLGRVVWFGIKAGFGAVVATLLAGIVAAAVWTLEPLSPLDKVRLLVLSGHFFVLLASAFAASLVTFGLVSRAVTWGGQYALLPVSKS